MITDDPGTPGNGHWENNIAVTFEHRPSETSFDSPLIDLNYGVGEHIQLTLQGGPVLLKRSGHGLIGGFGGTEAAVKWRFLDEEKSGFDVSMFPRVIFNITQSSVAAWPKMAPVFKSRLRSRRHSVDFMPMQNSVRSQALSAEANGFMESWAGWSWRKQQC
jgi:hypothetical protein